MQIEINRSIGISFLGIAGTTKVRRDYATTKRKAPYECAVFNSASVTFLWRNGRSSAVDAPFLTRNPQSGASSVKG
jgi:hypothetical protein